MIGRQLGHYEIVARLGAGGMGEVYRALDTRLARAVAIKVLPEHLAGDKEMLARFGREARALAALSHPNILMIFDFNSDEGLSYAVTELLEGETLRAQLESGRLAWDRALAIAIDTLAGLAAAHSKGVIHRDLKPENIFVTTTGTVKILDFGLARIEPRQPPAGQTSLPTMAADTLPGVIMGTVPYMSPEQLRGSVVDARSDIFSFGCVLYEMITGVAPFTRASAAETMAAIMKERPARISAQVKGTPVELEQIIKKCLEKERDDRYQSAAELQADLKALTSGAAVNTTATRVTRSQLDSGRRQQARRARKAIDSIAILPFENASKDADAEYLSDGITESLINSLSQLPKLRVMARSTVFRYKGRAIDAQAIGDELNVRAIVSGRVIQRADTLVIKTELVNVADGAQLWGEQYNRNISDIFSIEAEIAERIFEKLRLKLTGEEKKKIARRATTNTEAYQLYMKGRYYWNKRTEVGIKKGIEFFNQAIEKDAGYALAYAGLADSFALAGSYGGLPPAEASRRAKAAALKALELDSTLAEAYASLGYVKHRFDWDWPGGERDFKRALELNPDYATAHQWYGWYLILRGRFDEAMAELKTAQDIDPLSPVLSQTLGTAYYFARDYERAIKHYLKAIEMEPSFYLVYVNLGQAYEQLGRYDEAIQAFERSGSLVDNPWTIGLVAHAHALSGKSEEARALLARLTELTKHRYVVPYVFAIVHAALGESDAALGWLEKGYEERSPGLVFLQTDPRFDRLRADARFIDLVRRVGLDS